jgi:hypothetical protein
MEDQRRQLAEKEAAGRRATDAQVLEDAERLIAVWNERQAKRMPMIFSPTIGHRDHDRLLVPVGTLPSLRNNQCHRPEGAESSPRRGCDESHPGVSSFFLLTINGCRRSVTHRFSMRVGITRCSRR